MGVIELKGNYTPNSHKYRNSLKNGSDEKKEIKQVVKGKVTKKKKSGFAKFKEAFVEEGVSEVKSYVIFDIIIPGIKKITKEIIYRSVDMFLYGESSGRYDSDRRSSIYNSSSYRNYYEDSSRRRPLEYRSRLDYDFSTIILDNRGEAELVLRKLDEICDEYGRASVGDLYELIGMDVESTDYNYGWFNTRSATVVRKHDGYALNMPRVKSIK